MKIKSVSKLHFDEHHFMLLRHVFVLSMMLCATEIQLELAIVEQLPQMAHRSCGLDLVERANRRLAATRCPSGLRTVGK